MIIQNMEGDQKLINSKDSKIKCKLSSNIKKGVVGDERNFYSYNYSIEHPSKRKVSPESADKIPFETIEKGMMNKKSTKKI